MRGRWERQVPGVPLVVVESPYRALVGPLVAYLDVLDRAWPPDKPAPITFVVLPEYVARHWWERILYNQSAKRLRTALLGRPHTVVVNVPYRREDPSRPRRRPRERRRRDGAEAAREPAASAGVRGDGWPSPPSPARPTPDRSSGRWYRAPAALPDPTASATAGGIVSRRAGAQSRAAAFRRAVIALSGGPSDEPDRPARHRARPTHKAELIAVHVVEIDWTLPLDADVAGRSEEASGSSTWPRRRPRRQRRHGRGGPAPGPRRGRGTRRRGEPSGTPTCSSSACRTGSGSAATSRSGGRSRTCLKNAPCAVWVVREPIPEETA